LSRPSSQLINPWSMNQSQNGDARWHERHEE
jgi:hypothetical protein